MKNILALGYENISVVSSKENLPQKYPGIIVFTSLEEAVLKTKFEYAVIATPPVNHVKELDTLIEAGIQNIYVEKPLSNDLEGINALIKKLAHTEINIQVGFDMRYDPGLQKVQSLIAEKIIGQIVSVNAQVGQYLPDWRTGDYSKGISAKKELGGGVLLDLVHEFDYLYWLFGEVELLACLNTNSGALKIETEDVAELIFKFKNGTLGSLHLDYLQQKLIRNCLITGSEGTITWDLPSQIVSWLNGKKDEHHFSYTNFSRNDRFKKCMQDFLEKNDASCKVDFLQGIKSLQMVCAAKRSSETKQFISPRGMLY